jgi:hypothetical protein
MGVALTGGGVCLVGTSCGGTVEGIGLDDGGDGGAEDHYVYIDSPHLDAYPHIGIYEPDVADAPYQTIAPDLGADAPYDNIDVGVAEAGDAYAHIGIDLEAGEPDGYSHIKSP